MADAPTSQPRPQAPPAVEPLGTADKTAAERSKALAEAQV